MPSNKIYSVSEFVDVIRDYLEEGLGSISVQGEVVDFKISQDKFVFFEIKDKISRVTCFMMKSNLRVPLKDGIEIRVHGKASLFKKSGRFNINVSEIELVGKGALNKALMMLKEKLEKEGLFAEERKRELPRFPEKIGLITSPDAAARTDVLRVLKNRWSGVQVKFFPTGVQGPGSISTIVKAFTYLNLNEEVDVIILTRGGGSIEDLQSFNSEDVARAIFASSTPVVCGVGHERDWTIADLVADVRASTPSNAAERVVPERREILFQIDTLCMNIENSLVERIAGENDKINESLRLLENAVRLETQKAKDVTIQFTHSFSEFEHLIQSNKDRVVHNEKLINSLSPQATLNRGYSVTHKGENVLKSSKDVLSGDVVVTRLKSGTIRSKIT
ncbi:exodeoxyribonuclease VII large subunit [Patescibacteria group bacterium]